MTFSEIRFKMLKTDMKKYRLFILCNLSSIAILYSFLSISENKQFMNPSIVDPQISGNIYAPTFFIIMFMSMFIPYSQNIFIKARQKDYGILLSLGMAENDVIKSTIIENLVLSILSLILGLVLGTGLSLFFLYFVCKVIGINNIDISVSVVSYKTTSIYVSVIFAISLIINIYRIIKSTIYDKIKYTEKAESGRHYSIVFFLIGIVITIVDFVVMGLFHEKGDTIWLIRILLCMFGSLLIFYNGESLIEYFKNRSYKKYVKNIFLFSDIKYYYSKNKRIFFVNTWLVFGIIFFLVISIINYSALIKDSSIYHPFHMTYGEVKGHFEPLGDAEIESIVNNNGNSIVTNESVSFVRNNTFTIFCVDDINKILKKDYRVQSNSLIYVHPYDLNDNYEHEDIKTQINDINIDYKEGTKKFTTQYTILDPLFGEVNCISQNIILVNKEDYEWITLSSKDFSIKGVLHLYNFSNWSNSNDIVDEISNKLFEKNNIESGNRFYEISSRIDAYNKAIQSTNFLIFIFTYIWILMYFSYIIMIHFKLKMEYKDEREKYLNLYRIGISEIEVKKIMSKKILLLYFISFIYGIVVSVIFSYCFFSSYGYGNIAILVSFIASFIFSLIHVIIYKLYFKTYSQKITLELK
ncbi:FtsX-like permease family protein [Clostridium sp. SHJSY1]|uniref:FtsX-like permease family protein n=1 Tax=Clostridium sp. SHJSY1 TaxID=2942483 RepID=UPI00287BAB0C|nr:FtsX-like permease family protein [Clostridium sp. SHJSY1]